MSTAIRPLLILALLHLPAGLAHAQAPSSAPLTPPTRGKVLLLDNDRILEGDIEKVDGQYRVRRTVGEVWVPADRCKRLCKDLDETYEVMKRQINLKDADERLRLSRWCQMNGLKEHALHEAKIALDMRPEHPESVQLVQMLQRFTVAKSPVPASLAQPAAPQITLKTHAAARAPLDVSNESLVFFSTRVQPILMNTCISCHSHGNGGGFQLVRPNDGGPRTAAQANLNAALDFINLDRPVLSPLLIKAVVAHGGASAAPLKGRQSPPFQTMQTWVDQLLTGNPHLKEIRQAETQSSVSTSAKKDYLNEVFAAPERTPMLPPQPTETKKSGEIVSRPVQRLDEKTAPPIVAPAVPGPRDPFDPAEFNSRPK
jgi:hypothetical protein